MSMRRECGKVLNVSIGWRGEGVARRCTNRRPWWRALLGMTCAPCEARR